MYIEPKFKMAKRRRYDLFHMQDKENQVPQEIPPLRDRQNTNISESQKAMQMPQEKVWVR